MKNKLTIILLAVLALVLCTSIVSAAVTVTGTYDKSNPTFGSSSQVASNPNADDKEDRNVYVDKSITLSNSGSEAVSVASIVVTPESGWTTSKLDITLAGAVTIPANGSASASLKARIPESLNAVDTKESSEDYLKPVAFKVAKISFRDAANQEIAFFYAYMQRENKLQIDNDEVKVSIDGRASFRVKDGDKTKESVVPGEKVSVEVTARNKYSTSQNVEFEDVEVRYELTEDTDSSWDWDEIDESEDINSIDPKSTESATITFTVDEDVDEYDDYESYIYVLGEDEHGAYHGQKMSIRLDIQREKYDFRITSADVSPSVITCSGSRTANMDVKIQNFGRNSDNEVSVYVKSKELGVDFKKTNIALDKFGGSKDSMSISVPFSVSTNVKPGTYNIRVTLYYSGTESDGVQEDLKDLTLVVEDCKQTSNTIQDEPDDEPDVIIGGNTNSGLNIPPDVAQELGIVETKETSFFDTRAFDIILVAAVIVAFGALVFLVVKFLVL